MIGAVWNRVFGRGPTALGFMLAVTFFLWCGFLFFWCIALREEPEEDDIR
jgi:hypothetical protein